MHSEAPQLQANPERSQFHPSNLLVLTINGIARLEYWRRYAPPSERAERLHARVAAWKAEQGDFIAQRDRINRLRIASMDRPWLMDDLHEARRSYHFARANLLGDRALKLSPDSRFSQLRTGWLNKRINYHRAQAMHAAGKLLLPRRV
ncbi:MAG TPA: hypothetical protein VFB03_02925 [Candidatus Saccharimonadales bacterium]|nr:hypothetical protein [Candidatus Saccharimonadales bacterium]